MSVEVMKQALEALENSKPSDAGGMLDSAEMMADLWHAHYAAIRAMREAIRQEEAVEAVEPVAWVAKAPGGYHTIGYDSRVLNGVPHGTKLFAHPPQQ